jgi:hypothetical protein
VGAMVEEGKFRVEKFNGPKLPAMEDANGGLSISEEYFPTIGWNTKKLDDYEG